MRPVAGAGIEKTEPDNLRKISTDCTADTVSLKMSIHRAFDILIIISESWP
jgi:hypothetical protein